MLRLRTPSLGACLLGLLLSACTGGEGGRPFDRLERLVFLPRAPCILGRGLIAQVDCTNERPLLVDRFEVTREEWGAWADAQPAESGVHLARDYWDGEELRHPATGMTLPEARDFARSQGMRLPTTKEWLRVAVGTVAQSFPWGPVAHASVANTEELGLARLAPVGTFEAGGTSAGVYDLLGNAAEWVSEIEVPIVVADFYVLQTAESGDNRVWVMGGSFLSGQRATFSIDPSQRVIYNASSLLDPGHRGKDIGMRLFTDAETWLRTASKSWTSDAQSAGRLERVGQSWGARAVPLLRRLVDEDGSAPALRALLRGAES